MFTEPPAELIDQFDIVHVRLIGLAIKDNNVLSVIRNLRKLLRMNITYQSFFFPHIQIPFLSFCLTFGAH